MNALLAHPNGLVKIWKRPPIIAVIPTYTSPPTISSMELTPIIEPAPPHGDLIGNQVLPLDLR